MNLKYKSKTAQGNKNNKHNKKEIAMGNLTKEKILKKMENIRSKDKIKSSEFNQQWNETKKERHKKVSQKRIREMIELMFT